jgi:hypothetical protein
MKVSSMKSEDSFAGEKVAYMCIMLVQLYYTFSALLFKCACIAILGL